MKLLIIALPFLADNIVTLKCGIHPLRDVSWQHLGGALYVVYVPADQENMFRQRLRWLRCLSLTGIFDRIVVKEFATWADMHSFVASVFPWVEIRDGNVDTG